MGYPEGGNVLFNDALPLATLGSKILHSITGLHVNPYGWWMLGAYVLQGAMAARLVLATGARSIWAAAAAAALATCSWPFLWRLGHHGLASHFLILWTLAVYFESYRDRRPRIVELTLVAAITLLVNAYLFAMIVTLAGVSLVTLWMRGAMGRRDSIATACGLAALVVLGLAAGYGVMFTNPNQMRAWGYGVFSFNLVQLFVPPDGLFGFLQNIPRDATTGQYEGEGYIGHGALFVLAIGLLAAPRDAARHVRLHALLIVVLVAMAVYAASNRVYFGRTLLLSYELPGILAGLPAFFRASGRFIWPLSYALMLLPLAFIFRFRSQALAAAIAIAAAALQVIEARPVIEHRRQTTVQTYRNMLGDAPIPEWIAAHQRLFQFPSWGCGTLGPPYRSWSGPESNRELQMQLAAAKAGVPSNSIYTSRQLKICDDEFKWGRQPAFEDGVLYVLGPQAIHDSPPLTALVQANACVELSWAVVCSRAWTMRAGEAARRSADGPPRRP